MHGGGGADEVDGEHRAQLPDGIVPGCVADRVATPRHVCMS